MDSWNLSLLYFKEEVSNFLRKTPHRKMFMYKMRIPALQISVFVASQYHLPKISVMQH